jgi:hypothetical protein
VEDMTLMFESTDRQLEVVVQANRLFGFNGQFWVASGLGHVTMPRP